jgi:mannose-6-phosphate isomerase-like protein (cupin superfamily)
VRHHLFATAFLVSALVATLVHGTARGPVAAHQHGTPAAGGGVTTELLGRHPSAVAAGQALALMRVTFAPGGSVTAHTHPGDTIYHLVAGTLQFTLLTGEAQLVRATNGTPAVGTPTAVEPVPVGEEITLQAGDTIYYSSAAVQTERNDGDVDAVVLVANLRGVDEPARQFVGGTPAP